MSRWSSGYLHDYEPRGSGSITEDRNLEISILRIPSLFCSIVFAMLVLFAYFLYIQSVFL